MSEEVPQNATARIDRALARIEAAARRQRAEYATLDRRHSVLRNEIRDAVAALDELIAGEADENADEDSD